MKRFYCFCLLLLCILVANAQKNATISGRVLDSESAEALSYSTVQIMKTDSTSMVGGGVSNINGYYSIKNIPIGQYVMKVSYIGYHNFYRQLDVKEGQTDINGGTILLTPNSVMLQEAVITGTMRQVEVHEDTLIFNADAFKVPEGSVLD